jgi:hypothetical protein
MSDLSPQAQRLMQLTRQALSPDDAAVAALRAALDTRLGLSAVDQTLGRGTTLAAKTPLFKLVGLALFAGSLALSLVLFGLRDRHRPATPAARVAAPQPSAAGSAAPRAEQPAPAVAPAQALPASAASGTRATRATHRAHTPQRLAHDATRPSDLTPTPTSEAAPEPVDSLGPELALLRQARAALDRHDPEAALALLDQHAKRYPLGTMQQERLAARALALCALGRGAAAIATAQELMRLAPGSPYLARVRAGCDAERSK